MRKELFTAVCLAGATIAWFGPARGANYLPIPAVPGSVATIPFGINNSKTITGSWYDAGGVEHGFVGTLTGSYQTFDYVGAGVSGTEPRGINDPGDIVGFASNVNLVFGDEFVRDHKGALTTITRNGTPLDGIAQGISNAAGGTYDGDYITTAGRRAYLGRGGVWKQDLVLPFASTRTSARGVNNPGTVVGFFADTNFNPHGFILKGGAATQVDFPGAVGTFLEGVNDNGLATGYWTDSAGNSHAFTLDTGKGTYTSIVPPGTYANVQAFGVNDQGVVMVTTDAATGPSAFAYFADGGGYVYGARLITVHDQPSLQLAGRPTQSSSGPRSSTGAKPIETRVHGPGRQQP